MKKTTAFLGTVFLVCSCASLDSGKMEPAPPPPAAAEEKPAVSSMREQSAGGYWITRPSDNALVILGLSSKMLRHDDEIAAAKEDAARKIALFYGIHGKIESTYRTGAFFFDYISDSQISLTCDNDYTKYIDQLTFDPQHDLTTSNDGTIFIRFQYTTAARPFEYRSVVADNGHPNWIHYRDLPRFDGYIVAVGIARNQRLLKDTVYKSTEAAAAKILEELYMNISANDTTVTRQSSTSSVSTIYAVSEGRLNNFHVLEYWRDPQTGYVYTLAVAKR